jgi:HlyD family secretion protein
MDRKIEKKKGLKRKHIPYIAGGVLLLAALGWMIFGNHTSKYRVERDKVTVSDVTSGEFNDYVRINGRVQPISSIQLSALEGGVVAEKLVEEGTMVHRGQVLVRLTNPNMTLNILNSEAQLAEKQNFLRNTQVTMEQDRLNLKRERLQLETDVTRKQRRADQFAKLYEEKLCSREEYLQAAEDARVAKESYNLVRERQKQDEIYRGIQVKQMEESLHNMQQNLMLVRERVSDLDIKAPVDGQLGLLEVEIGQNVGAGMKIGQINVLSDYKVEAMIDEHYIDRVRPDLEASFERQDKNFGLRVRKVFPEVRDKQFRTEFVFSGERPDNIRTGQTYYINLQLGQPQQAIMIPRGAFYQTTGGQWIYVLSKDGKRAVRREITIGRQNPQYYEVTSGLQPGERVVTSSYESFGEAQELVLK